MTVGTANTKSTLVDGNTLPAAEVDDLATLASRSDDEVLYDLFDLEPPTAATSTFVNVGYVPFRSGPIVQPIGGSHSVIVQPARWCRSSTDSSQPRRMLSATVNAQTIVSLLPTPGAGLWGIELLYAQLSYIDATDPAKGTQVQFLWAPSPTYVVFANAANIATLPANTATTWNIPVQYVKNYAGMTYANGRDILSPTPSTSGGYDGKLRRRAQAALGGINAHRGYASTPQALATLVAANTVITSTATHPGAHKGDSEVVVRTFNLPGTMTGDSGGVQVLTDLDDTRDWRNATFVSFWNVCESGVNLYLGEEDSGTDVSGHRQSPRSDNGTSTYAAQYIQFGQSFEEYGGTGASGGLAVIANCAKSTAAAGSKPFQGTTYFDSASVGVIGLVVDMTTGKLRLRRTMSAGVFGGPVSIFLIATFPNNSR